MRCAPALVPAPRARSRLPRPAGLRQADTSEESRAGAGFQVPRSAFAVALREDPKVGALSARPLSSGLPGVAAPHCCRQPWSLRLSPGRHGPLCRSVPETAASAGPTQTRQGQGAHPGPGARGPVLAAFRVLAVGALKRVASDTPRGRPLSLWRPLLRGSPSRLPVPSLPRARTCPHPRGQRPPPPAAPRLRFPPRFPRPHLRPPCGPRLAVTLSVPGDRVCIWVSRCPSETPRL